MADQSTEFHCEGCGQQLPLRPREDDSSHGRDYCCTKCGQEHNALFDLKAPEGIWHRVRLAD